MVEILELILGPVIWALNSLTTLFAELTGSPGLAVIMVSVVISTLALPLLRYGRKIEDRTQRKVDRINKLLAPLKREFSGEALFLKTEALFKAENYHPIENTKLGASFLFLLPFLISALFVFSDHPSLIGQSFLAIDDLTKPDQLLFGTVNLLPICMSALTLVDAFLRYGWSSSLTRFIIIAVVLFVLVYKLAAALVIYWTMNNLYSFALNRWSGNTNPV